MEFTFNTEKEENEEFLKQFAKIDIQKPFNSQTVSNPLVFTSDKILLNIGGKLFTTFKKTLLKYDSIFTELLKNPKNDNCEYDPYKNSFFFDRDPKYFRIILNYFRNGVIIMPAKENQIKEFKYELLFYQIKINNEEYKDIDIIESKPNESKIKEIQINNFEYQDFFDKKGVIYYLGTRNSKNFENPFDLKLINIYTPEGFYPLFGDMCCESKGNETLKKIFNYNTLQERYSISFLSYFGLKFEKNEIKLTEITLGTCYPGSIESFLPDNIDIYGLKCEKQEEIYVDNPGFVKLTVSLLKKIDKIKTYKISECGTFNYFMIKNPLKKMLVISCIEIYGELK